MGGLLRALLVGMLCVWSVSATGQECGFRGKPAGATPVPRQELVDIFVDHTVTVPDGHALYLAPDGTTKAINEKTGSIGKGHWKIDDQGHVCFEARFSQGMNDTVCKLYVRAPSGRYYNRDFLGPDRGLWWCSEAQRKGMFGFARAGDSVMPRIKK